MSQPEPPHRAQVSKGEFGQIFEQVSNWGRWGDDDERGTLNLLTSERTLAATRLVRTGRCVSMALPISSTAGPDNPHPAVHFMSQMHDIDIGSGGVTFAMDFLGMDFHGDCHTHIDALCHIAYEGRLYNGRPATNVTSHGSRLQDITVYGNGVAGRGVLLDIPRLRGIEWLEPGEAVTRAELEAAESAEGVRLGVGDILVFRTGHHARRLGLGAWDNSYAGEGKAGLHVDTIPWMHERGIAAFLPDGDGEAVPSSVDGILYPIHPLQITAMGMACSDSLDLEGVARVCAEERRWDFLVMFAPLRLPGGTGSPFNPIAVF